MISFENLPDRVKVTFDKNLLPEAYWPDYRKATIMKAEVCKLILDINDNVVFIYYSNGDITEITYQGVHPSYGLTSNEDLYNLLDGYLTIT